MILSTPEMQIPLSSQLIPLYVDKDFTKLLNQFFCPYILGIILVGDKCLEKHSRGQNNLDK